MMVLLKNKGRLARMVAQAQCSRSVSARQLIAGLIQIIVNQVRESQMRAAFTRIPAPPPNAPTLEVRSAQGTWTKLEVMNERGERAVETEDHMDLNEWRDRKKEAAILMKKGFVTGQTTVLAHPTTGVKVGVHPRTIEVMRAAEHELRQAKGCDKDAECDDL